MEVNFIAVRLHLVLLLICGRDNMSRLLFSESSARFYARLGFEFLSRLNFVLNHSCCSRFEYWWTIFATDAELSLILDSPRSTDFNEVILLDARAHRCISFKLVFRGACMA